MKKISLILMIVLSSLGFGCGSNTTENQTSAEAPSTTQAAEEEKPTADAVGNETVIELNAGDDMKYDLSEIKVKEGQLVKLTLKHIGKLAKTAMGHNFVLLKSGVNANDFASKAIAAVSSDYIPKDLEGEIIVHTKLIGGGESDSIEFNAPAKGTYPFLCSFPGHSAMMKGVFIIE